MKFLTAAQHLRFQRRVMMVMICWLKFTSRRFYSMAANPSFCHWHLPNQHEHAQACQDWTIGNNDFPIWAGWWSLEAWNDRRYTSPCMATKARTFIVYVPVSISLYDVVLRVSQCRLAAAAAWAGCIHLELNILLIALSVDHIMTCHDIDK
jgi:hypothetical protein